MSSNFPIMQRPTLRLRLVRLPSKLRPLHETSFPVRPHLARPKGPAPMGAPHNTSPGKLQKIADQT